LLANKLGPLLDSLVSKCQSAFIKRRSIHDNFLYVQNMVRTMQKLKLPALFLKLDIHKAFDTVSWSYLLEVMQALGFGPRWHEWVSILFRTTSSRVLFNGQQGPAFSHRRGCVKVTLYRPCCSSSPWTHYNVYWKWQHNMASHPICLWQRLDGEHACMLMTQQYS
jgi:hypothetical protein